MKTSSIALLAGVGIIGYVMLKNSGTAQSGAGAGAGYMPVNYIVGGYQGGPYIPQIANAGQNSGLVNTALNYIGGGGGQNYGSGGYGLYAA